MRIHRLTGAAKNFFWQQLKGANISGLTMWQGPTLWDCPSGSPEGDWRTRKNKLVKYLPPPLDNCYGLINTGDYKSREWMKWMLSIFNSINSTFFKTLALKTKVRKKCLTLQPIKTLNFFLFAVPLPFSLSLLAYVHLNHGLASFFWLCPNWTSPLLLVASKTKHTKAGPTSPIWIDSISSPSWNVLSKKTVVKMGHWKSRLAFIY